MFVVIVMIVTFSVVMVLMHIMIIVLRVCEIMVCVIMVCVIMVCMIMMTVLMGMVMCMMELGMTIMRSLFRVTVELHSNMGAPDTAFHRGFCIYFRMGQTDGI